jgi:hypothetical protein
MLEGPSMTLRIGIGKAVGFAFGLAGFLQSPFWFVAECALVGLVIGYCATRFGGEGAATVDHRAA